MKRRRPKLERLSRLRWLPVANDVTSLEQEAYEDDCDGTFVDLRSLLDDELERRGITVADLAREVELERRAHLRVVDAAGSPAATSDRV